jgi:SH3 domain protein
MKQTMQRIILTLLLIAATTVQAAHITDKLLVGFYEEPDESTQPTRVLSSGAPIEVLKREGDFSQVRLFDGSVGWIKTDYVTNDKPAKAIVLELQAKTGELQQQLRKQEQELKTLRAAAAEGKDTAQLERELESVRQQLAEANKKIEELRAADGPADEKTLELEKELNAAAKALEESRAESMLLRDQLKMLTGEAAAGKAGQARILELETELAAANKALEESAQSNLSKEPELLRLQQANLALRKRIGDAAALLGSAEEIDAQELGASFSWWYLLLPLLAIGGFLAGVAVKDYLVRRRYGGFRI